MNIEKLREVIRKYEENYNYFNDQAHDEIFKWNAVQHFQNVWLAPKANERSFPELFADARKKCSVLIDNAYVCPSSGVVKIAEKRPDEVEYLFRKVLLAPDGGDIDIRQDNVERFLDEMDRLCRETFPASFKYKQDRHAALCYLTLLKPDDNYIYRYSEAEEFAKHMEFGLDIGSGKSFCLKNYYILCNAVADELRGQRSLLDKVEQRIQEYSQRHNRKVVFAYLLLPGINDRSSDIRQLAKWFKGKNVMINVLQYNPTSNSKIRAPQKQEMVAFKHQLEQTGLEVTMRVSHGREIKAACGQLANTYNKAKKQQK